MPSPGPWKMTSAVLSEPFPRRLVRMVTRGGSHMDDATRAAGNAFRSREPSSRGGGRAYKILVRDGK